MPLLYHWRRDNYVADLDAGAAFHLNQGSPRLHEIECGDSLWAFTRDAAGHYVMAAELAVTSKTRNHRGYHYGAYRVWGDLERSRYFAVDGQLSAEEMLRSLSPRAEARVLGRAFQGHAAVRPLTAADDAVLRAWCRDLPLEPRAHADAAEETRLELGLLAGEARPDWELPGIGDSRRRQLRTEVPVRNRKLVGWLQRRYDGACQLCAWQPRRRYGADVCEGHHLQWLSRGGADRKRNLILLCPNHHRLVHACDAHFDFGDLCMDFGTRREPLRQPGHLGCLQRSV